MMIGPLTIAGQPARNLTAVFWPDILGPLEFPGIVSDLMALRRTLRRHHFGSGSRAPCPKAKV
jgi:hypothetical protein